MTDYRWNLTPLSSAGSIKGIGQPFPALYIGKTFETGLCEYFGSSLNLKNGALSLHDLALRRPTSFTTFALRGRIEHVLDLRVHKHLKPFTDIIRTFHLSVATQRFGRNAKRPLYPSQQGGEECLAVYPENFTGSDSRIEVGGGIPNGANCTVLDKNNICLDGIMPPTR